MRSLDVNLNRIGTELDNETGALTFRLSGANGNSANVIVSLDGAKLLAKTIFEGIRTAEAAVTLTPAQGLHQAATHADQVEESEFLYCTQIGAVLQQSGQAHLRFHTTEGYVANVLLSAQLAQQLAFALAAPHPANASIPKQ